MKSLLFIIVLLSLGGCSSMLLGGGAPASPQHCDQTPTPPGCN